MDQSKKWLIFLTEGVDIDRRIKKEHFGTGKTGRSALRRTLGAILKKKLILKAIPRNNTKSDQNIQLYSFDEKDGGEQRLTDWMKHNLEVSVYYCFDDIKDRATLEKALKKLKKDLITEANPAEPILNLNEWQNPHKDRIEELKIVCRDEAKSDC